MTVPVWLDLRDAVTLHDRMLVIHGGASGLRDIGLLESALARPQQHHLYNDGADVVDLAALYSSAIVRNHPFIDGNKRTGFVLGILFLELNGFLFRASEEEAAQAMLALAAGTIEAAEYAAFLRVNSKLAR